ncbi:MAG: RNA polymerase sigma factor [Anaerolineae bacterium]
MRHVPPEPTLPAAEVAGSASPSDGELLVRARGRDPAAEAAANASPSDRELLVRARGRDPAALAAIYDRYRPGLRRYAARLLNSAPLADECAAEAFSRFIDAIEAGGGPDEHLKAYLYRTAHNWIADHFAAEPPLPLDGVASLARADEPSDRICDDTDHAAVRLALSRLSEEQRTAVILSCVEGMSDAAIARAMGTSERSVRSLRRRALLALESMLASQM